MLGYKSDTLATFHAVPSGALPVVPGCVAFFVIYGLLFGGAEEL